MAGVGVVGRLVDQYLDRTRLRAESFFGDGIVAHVSMAHPVCPRLANHLAAAGRATGAAVHDGGTLVCIEGPAFSTLAESLAYRAQGVDVIGMTAMPEAKLAREAELHYATVAMVTDYDCWHESEGHVTVDAVLAMLKKNGATAKKMLEHALSTVGSIAGTCGCATALKAALQTDKAAVPQERIDDLRPLVGKYYA